MKVAILRPREYIEKTIAKIKDAGFDAVGVPFVKIVRYVDTIDLSKFDFDVLIVTSQTTAKILANSENLSLLRDKKIVAIGKKTAEVFELHGLDVEVPSKFDSKTMYDEFKHAFANKNVLALRSDKGNNVLLKLSNICNFSEIKVYGIEFEHSDEQKRFVEEVFRHDGNYVIVFSSSMIAKSFIELSKKLGFNVRDLKQTCIAIGPPTKEILERSGVKALIPSEYTFDGVIKLLKNMAK